ncbi:DUF1272 domain-containing protein [Rhizobium leguminosarum]|uniref:DUF1272 domain-containing protein n=1 Tax=Rhizobium leguminosarum TaxID=384 RepID=UPI003F9802CF
MSAASWRAASQDVMSDCVDGVLEGVCPNCGGNLVARPIRTAAMLAKNPASTKRVLKAEGCEPKAA